MFRSVAQLGWDGPRTGASLLVFVASLCGAACAGELEAAAEYQDAEPLEAPPAGSVVAPAAPEAVQQEPGEQEPVPHTPEAPAPEGSSAAPGIAAPGGDAAELPLPLATEPLVPASEHCAAVADWDPLWVQFEEEVLLLVNEARSQPANCGDEGFFAAAEPLVMDPILRCSARLHSLDMFERHFFNHTNPDGEDPFQRMGAAGFRGGGAAENIAVGQTSPAQVMQSWLDSDGHCSNVMRRNYAVLGVGYHPGVGKRGLSSNFWTQNFGAPPRSCRSCR